MEKVGRTGASSNEVERARRSLKQLPSSSRVTSDMDWHSTVLYSVIFSKKSTQLIVGREVEYN